MRLAISTLLASSLAACDPAAGTDACGIPNDGLSMVATAVDNGVSIHAEVDFGEGARTGPPGSLALCDGDELTIAGEKPERTDRTDRVVYSASLDASAARVIEFMLKRDGEDDLAFAVELAPPFDITAPTSDQEVSRSSDFMLAWGPANDGAEIHIGLAEEIGYGICLETTTAEHDYKSEGGVVVDDKGSWNVPASVIDGGTRDKCDATYRLTRFTTPSYPAAFHSGGFLEGRVERFVAFVSVP